MTEKLILAAARKAVAAALSGWRDWSDDPAAIKPDKLGAFAVTVTRNGAVAAAMGSDAEEVSLTVGVDVFVEFGAYDNGREIATGHGAAVMAALRRDAELLALTDYISGAVLDVDLAQAEKRLARASVALSVQATF